MTLLTKHLTVANRLHDVSTAISAGEVTAICGPNGAGKSTLLSALAGLLVADSGLVTLDGDVLGDLPPRRRARQIGYLPQDGEVAWDMTVRSLIGLGRLPHGDIGTAPIDAAIAALELHDLADRAVSKISGGERARALLGRVLAGEPQWILADEPLAALDLAHQLTLIRHLRRAAKGGTGVVIVVHDLALAMNHADRVIVLDDGQVEADAKPETALSAELIKLVWNVDAKWLGYAGAKALVAH